MTIARHVADVPAASEFGRPAVMPGASRTDAVAVSTVPATTDYSNQGLLLARLKPGLVVESRREVHVFPVTAASRHATELTARCGVRLPIADLQWLPGVTGMPCGACVMNSL